MISISKPSADQRPVYTKDDNYKDIVLISILNIKEKQSPHHSYKDKGTEKRYCWNHLQNDFIQLMNAKNIDQNQSCYNWHPIRISPAIMNLRI